MSDDEAVAWDRAWELAKSYHKPLADIRVHNPYLPMTGEHTFSEYRTSSRAGYKCSCGSAGSGTTGGTWGDYDPWTAWREHYWWKTHPVEDPFGYGSLTTRKRRWWQWL